MKPLAGSLLLLRDREDPRVLWARRGRSVRFLSGFMSFPGGGAEDGDEKLAGLEGLEPRLAGALGAAIRETCEEIGIIAAGGPTVRVDPATRTALCEGRQSFGEVLRANGQRIRPERFVAVGVWAAPPYLGTDFETRFFAVRVEDVDESACGFAPFDPDEEISGAEWVRPAEAIAQWIRGEVLLAPPTLELLGALGASDDRESARRFVREPEARNAPTSGSPIRPHIALFPVRTPTLPPATHTNCYIIGDRELLVIDAASPYADEQTRLAAWIDARCAEGRRVKAVAITHSHRDHVGGTAALAAHLDVPIWGHAEAAARVGFEVDRRLEDGDVIELEGATVDVLHTPGHAPGHLCYLDRATRSLVAGDMVAGLGTILIAPGDGDMALYLAQLGRLRDLAPTCLMPSHGPVIGGVREKLDEYIDHRLQREQQIVEALELGAADVMTIVSRAYPDVDPALWPIAQLSVCAHLDKLAAEGRAHCESARDGRWAVGPSDTSPRIQE